VSKYALLKDLTGRVAGYVRADETAVLCRMQLGFAAELAVVFFDGSQKDYALSGGLDEQCIPCDGKNMRGCYVFREDELLLISDEPMRSAFGRRVPSCTGSSAECRVHMSAPDREKQETDTAVSKAKENQERKFPQRRWPQSPCWDTALYCQGSWREPAEEPYREPGC